MPSGSDEELPSKFTVKGATPLVGLAEITACGGFGASLSVKVTTSPTSPHSVVDGEEIEGTIIPILAEGKEHVVEVTMGKPVNN